MFHVFEERVGKLECDISENIQVKALKEEIAMTKRQSPRETVASLEITFNESEYDYQDINIPSQNKF